MLVTLPYRFLTLLRNQWLPPEKLQQIQQRKLHRLLQHAYHHVPYYRRLFDAAGVKPNHIQDIADLAKLPVTRKADLLTQAPQNLIAGDIDPSRCVRLRTSGSLGMPFEVLFRPEDRAWWALLALRGWMAHQYQVWHKMLVLSDARFVSKGHQWWEYLGLARQYHTSIYDSLEQQIERLATVKPDVIRGMPSDVYLLAKAIRENHVASVTPKIVFTSAELLDPGTRRFINETFNVQLADFYGSIECGWIGWECPAHVGYHLNADCLIVEFLRDGKAVNPGEPGEIVVTNLHSSAMPFIRYSVGDVGIPKNTPCPCGRGLPLMDTVEGRMVDCLTLSDGRTVSPYQLTCLVEQIPGIQRYQIIQTHKDEILVKIIPDGRFTEQISHRIIVDLTAILGEKICIHTELVQELPKDSSGKFRVVKSHLSL